jgi:hypothetical protein
MKRILTITFLLALSIAARADVIVPAQFGNRLLRVPSAGGTCNTLDFSQACNSQYISVLGLM